MALLVILISISISVILVPLVIRIAKRNGWYDSPNDRKIHKGKIPRLGGVAIFVAFAVATVVVMLTQETIVSSSFPLYRMLLCGAAVTLVFAIGLFDDFRNIPALWKAAGQLGAASLAVLAGCLIQEVYVPFLWRTVELGAFAYPVTILWLVGMSNAVNLIDGMDGLAGGVSLIAAAAFAVVGIVEGNLLLTLLSLALFGGTLGFLVFNLPKASIFMGDSGSLMLGFVLALLPLIPFTSPGTELSIIQPVTILLIPILDTAAAIVRRRLRGEPIHAPDKEHLHHKLLDLGLSTRRALVAIYGAGILLGATAVFYEFVAPWIAAVVFMAVLALGGGSLRLLVAKHASVRASSLAGFVVDNVSYNESGALSASGARDLERAAK